jgi:hypothetical protein
MPGEPSVSLRLACAVIAASALLFSPPVTIARADGLSATVERPLSADVVAGIVNFSGNSTGAQGVQVSIDSGTWWNASGVPAWRYLWNSTAASNGVHSVQARAYNGSAYAGSATVQFSVNNTPPSSMELTLDVSPQQVYSGEDFIASGMARYDNDVRVSGGNVQITVSNLTANATTDSRGYYSAQLAAPLPPGKTAVRASLSSSGLSSNALAYIDVVFRSPPDLAVSGDNITFDPQEPSGGEQVTIGAIVSNMGGTDASARVRFSTSGHDPQDVHVNVTAGGSWPASVRWTLPSGRHSIDVSLQDTSPYDANSSNDNASRELHILASPDLAVAAIIFSNSRPTEGMTITIQARIINSGETSSTGIVTFFDGHPPASPSLGAQRVSVPANSTRTVFQNWNTTRGTHNITVVVGNLVPEDPDLSDNELTRPVEVSKKSSPPAASAPGFGAAALSAIVLSMLVFRSKTRLDRRRN